MALDITLLNQFDLMDYSLLFCIEYNPEYVKHYPEEFLHDKHGKLKLPVTMSQKAKKASENQLFKKMNK